MNAPAAKHVGAKLLGEVEESSLEELLDSLRVNIIGGAASNIRPEIPVPALANIATRYHKATQSSPPPVLSVSGRYLPLLYHLISTLIADPHNYTVVIVDAESRFDVTRLISSPISSDPASHQPSGSNSSNYPAKVPDLRHVHIYRPARGQEEVRAAVAAADQWMLYGNHGSRAREWWGTVVIGGGSGAGGGMSVKGDVNAGWKGWLRVEREEVSGFPAGVSVEEALHDRGKRQEVVDAAGWVAMSRVGGYVWKDV
ncbi:uncharacterized protein GGS22DRAFT_193065 [Annulohypoxylon maeteangense]|uniref:uncharacterized protein n=1 Tax=Annulohypoxylon maeteangense TaxID=1927788 RepID=UPI0020085FDE|nr:uncharacterized protein GGS22DRAFT_193065 [Annulohypoxylon maeteangense]KAI0880688.1 hypothetical protein GGS22DRAFT_193065 [Annulohypoxylon maeteangense]